MKIESYKCDQCGTELIKDTEYPHEYGLVLSVEDFNRNTNNSRFAVYQHPPLKRTHHFCAKVCLREWCVTNVTIAQPK